MWELSSEVSLKGRKLLNKKINKNMALNEYVGKAVCGSEKSKSESQEIIIRINNKIDSLYDILRPIYLSQLKDEIANEKLSSQLVNDLLNIEHRITQLLDGIRI